jgi:ATP-binding cassette subfamily B multidrug efflux pump
MSPLNQILSVYLTPLWKSYVKAFLLIVVTAWVSVKIPEIVGQAVNGNLDPSHRLPLTVICLGCLQIIVRTYSRIFIFTPARELEENLKNSIFSKLMSAPMMWLQTRQIGDLQSLINSDTGHLRVFLGLGGLQVTSFVTLAIFAISKMLIIHVTLTLIVLFPILFAIPILRFGMPKVMKLNLEQQKILGSLTSKITEAFVNVHVIQSTSSETTFIERIKQKSEDLRKLNLSILKIRLLIFPLLPLLTGISSFLIFLYGGYEAISGRLTTGDLIAFTSYVALLAFPLGIVGMVLAMWQRAQAAANRISVALESKSESDSNSLKSTSQKALEIRNLSFSFEEPLLKNVSLRVLPGQIFGVAGPIGSGKSTLLALASSLIQPPPGTVYIDDFDITNMEAREVRRNIGLVPQTAQLFSVSIRENLLAGLDVSEDELWNALEISCMSQDVRAMPQGPDTPIGEKGIRLSGGQKQRLALARQLIRKTPILLLDDVISAVDQVTEDRILNELRSLKRTVLLVTHRESAIQRCDHVLRLGASSEVF